MEEAGQENTALSEWRAWESDYNERNKTSFVFCFFFFLLHLMIVNQVFEFFIVFSKISEIKIFIYL